MAPPRLARHLASAAVLAAALGGAVPAGAAPPAFPGLTTVTVASTDGTLTIPDNGSLVVTLPVSGLPGRLVDVDVALDVAHPNAADLEVTLVSPGGTAVVLTTDNGASNDDVFAGVLFDDQAAGTPSAANVRNVTFVDLTPVGAVQPEGALGAMAGEDPNGLWALVLVDDAGGQTGTIRSWSLTLSTLPAFAPGPAVSFPGTGGSIPNNNPAGLASPVQVAGLGPHLGDVEVTVDIAHPNAADIDLFLTSPGGRRIDLVTDVGGGNDNLYAGTRFDDDAPAPVSDETLPADGTAFTAVVPEGALGAFLGEDPNGTWTLTVVDDASGNTGTLNGWTLAVRTTGCGDGELDPGEACDDGNAVDGDGCQANCTATPPGGGGCPGCTTEVLCDDCADDDGNGLVDLADPACQATPFALAGTVAFPRGPARAAVRLAGAAAVPEGIDLPVGFLLADADGAVACGTLGPLLYGPRGVRVAKGGVGGGTVTLKVRRDGRIAVRGAGLDVSALDQATFVGVHVGGARLVAPTTFRRRGRSRWVAP